MLVPRRALSILLRNGSTMSAWRLHNYGGSNPELRLDKVPFPKITSPNEVLLKVHATSVNPLDVMMVKGYGKNVIGTLRSITEVSSSPVTLGRDFSGTVIARGGNVINKFKPGDEVWGATFPSLSGCHAEYIVVNKDMVTKKPSGISHEDAASIPYAALTAWSALTLTALTQNEWNVLVIGAAGGVGSLAVQILKSWSCRVTAVCSTDAVELVSRLGVDSIIDYKSVDFMEDLSKMQKFDVILDCTDSQENYKVYIPLLTKGPHANYVSLSSPILSSTDSKGILGGLACSTIDLIRKNTISPGSYRWGYFAPNQKALRTLSQLVESNRLVPVVQEVLDFSDMLKAHARVENGHARGKVVISLQMNKANMHAV